MKWYSPHIFYIYTRNTLYSAIRFFLSTFKDAKLLPREGMKVLPRNSSQPSPPYCIISFMTLLEYNLKPDIFLIAVV